MARHIVCLSYDFDALSLPIAKGKVSLSAPEGIEKQLKKLNARVSKMAYDVNTFTGKLDENADLLEEMVKFARAGSDLRQVIELTAPSGTDFSILQPIQLVTKTLGEKIPLEFAYDYPAPKPQAPLCPGAIDYLKSNTKCPHEHTKEAICPSGFWGLNRIIERHEYSRKEPAETPASGVEITATRRTIPIGDRALFAGTQVVDAALTRAKGLSLIKAQLDLLTENRCVQVASWEEWGSAVSNNAPDLLVLVVHTDYDDDYDEQKMEIGVGKWLHYNSIETDVVSGGAENGPLVFLIGCETGHSDIEYMTLADKFKRAGAAIVISSGATIHSGHAVPVLERLVALLREKARQSGLPFGHVMQTMRREMLSEGIPIILCITAYGDADWLLT